MPVAAAFNPALTTLHIDFVQVGRLAVDLLLGRIFGRPSASTVYFEPQLVVRGSTAPATPPSRIVSHVAQQVRGQAGSPLRVSSELRGAQTWR